MEVFNFNTEEMRNNVKIDSYGLFVYKITISTRKSFDYPVIAVILGVNRREQECFRNGLSNNKPYSSFDYIFELKNRH